MARNTICTAGDANYLWGMFILVASMRRHGMEEPVLAGLKGVDAEGFALLEQFGGVERVDLDHAERSLTCHKAEVMLKARTEWVTWADGDAMFKGNCSGLLAPGSEDRIRVRVRKKPEMRGAFPRRYDIGEILRAWRVDVAAAAGIGAGEIPEVAEGDAERFLSCSACFLSVARSREKFLETWHGMMMRLPRGDVGVVDRRERHYHQLDESCLNAVLKFLPGAPEPEAEYGLDRDPERHFLHFIGRPKPWEGWTPQTVWHHGEVVRTVEWAVREGYRLPGGAAPRAIAPGSKPPGALAVRAADLARKALRRVRRWAKG